MVNRILQILKYKNLTASKFADEIGVQRSSISHILSERNKPSLEFIQKILNTYTEINSEWLLTGKNSMLNAEPDLFSDTINSKSLDLDESNLIHEVEQITNVNNECLQNEIVNFSNNDTIVNNAESPNNTVKENINTSKSAKKDIERIIVFYTDKTFVEYNPE